MINIPLEANELIKLLQNNGHSAYVVGGCVRDSILNRKPNDWDICTSATPNEMLNIFKDYKVIETGLRHGTITVVNNSMFEITTYRIDGEYTDNRRPDNVTFTNNLIEDLKRRDFTINAIAYNDTEGLIDPFDGVNDINNKIIKCVGNAKDRFEEDALRILRAIRFASQLNFKIDDDTNTEINNQYKKLKNISIERINNEFCKILYNANIWNNYLNVLTLIIPRFKNCIGFKQGKSHPYDVWNHTLKTISNCSNDIIIRLAALFHDIGKPDVCFEDGDGRHFHGHAKISAQHTEVIMKNMRFDNNTIKKVVSLVKYHDIVFEESSVFVKQWLSILGEEQFKRLIELRKADILGQDPDRFERRLEKVYNVKKITDEIINNDECYSLKQLAINGNDLIKLGYEDKKIGEMLNTLLNIVIDDNYLNNKESLLNIINNLK